MPSPKEIIRGPERFAIQRRLLSDLIRERFAALATERPIEILEAGCGRQWILDLGDLDYTLTGLDLSPEALDIRQNQQGDLDRSIVGDLRTAQLEEGAYDVIFCSNVLEHVDGAEQVLDNFFRWLRPGGLACLIHPDRDSAFGFATRLSPHWLHVAYYKYVRGKPMAGQPGHGPFPTHYDPVVSHRGVRDYCRRHGHRIVLERGVLVPAPRFDWAFRLVGRLTRERLASKHNALLFAIERGG